ncbi:MAG: prolyl oligopeptidase family serine peptidase [Fimbriimonadaceae bacterium]|nr:prolyl oligopeptidase family serine peptidase [Fimbriimonadaceae bacterium]
MVAALALTLLTAGPISDLQAVCRDGQTFLAWREAPELGDRKLQVLQSREPLTRLDGPGLTTVAAGLLPGSAVDWWENPETYGKPSEPGPDGRKPDWPRRVWRLGPDAPALDPQGGLLVHTVTPQTAGPTWYAVVVRGEALLEPGRNVLAAPVTQTVGRVRPIWQGEGPEPAAGTGLGKCLDLVLHAKTGRGGQDWLVFGDGSLGWREGLPFKFGTALRGDAVVLAPTDRTWIDRLMPEGLDLCQRLTPAIHSFWFGYNSRIDDPAALAQGTVVPYTERRLLWMVDFVKRHYGTDPQRSYCTGSSMGGCGTISFGLRHPEVFAACVAWVPIVGYGASPGGDSTMRVAKETGGMDARTDNGQTVAERLDTTAWVRSAGADLPVLRIVNGRRDGSIPWGRLPAFYGALQDRRQAVLAAWNEGDHGTASGLLADDVKPAFGLGSLRRCALNRPYVAFSRCSADDDPGRGEPRDGTPVGYLNRGLDHGAVSETATGCSVVLRCTVDPAKLPLTVDVTVRRRQVFRPAPGSRVRWQLAGGPSGDTSVGADGLLTVTGVRLVAGESTLVVGEP